jgi:hypothetical protein
MELTGTHATPLQRHQVSELERAVAVEPSIANWIQLAIAYVEPLHRHAEALALIDRILAADPEHAEAALWRSYLALVYLMTEDDLAAADRRLARLSDLGELEAAALVLRPQLLDDLGQEDAARDVAMLERSVLLAPGWSKNHLMLGRRYASLGHVDRAQSEERIAREHLIDDQFDLPRWAFEVCFTGRLQKEVALEPR